MKPPPFPTSPILISIISAAVGLGLFAVFIFYISYKPAATPLTQSSTMVSIDPRLLIAKAAVVYDPKTKRILFAKNAQTSLPLASLTKLMTAQTVLSAESTSTWVTITLADLKPEGDWGFEVGDTVKLHDLITFALVASSNDAIAAVAGSLGSSYLDEMNRTAGNLGLSHTYFLNPTGLDLNEDTSGAYGSAYDVAVLASAFLKQYPQYFETTSQSKISIQDGNKILSAAATALPLLDIPGFIGAKTGYTNLAGGNIVVAYDVDINHPLIAVILGSTQDGRFSDARQLIEASRLSAQAGAAQ